MQVFSSSFHQRMAPTWAYVIFIALASFDMDIDRKKQLTRVLDIVLSIIGLLSFGLLIANFGFSLKEHHHNWVLLGFEGIVVVFVIQEIFRWVLASSWWESIKNRWLEFGFSVILLTSLLSKGRIEDYIEPMTNLEINDIFLMYLGITQLILFSAQLVRFLRRFTLSAKLEFTPARIFVISFMFPIFIGTLLLKLPKASLTEISWLDALFTATSAVCVTGLTTFDISQNLTPLGQTLVCILFQIGGLGIMTLTMSFGLLFSGGLGVKERIVLGDLLAEERMGEVGSLLLKVTLFTFAFEGVGAALLYTSRGGLWTDFDFVAFASAVFHSISAFCNAGFSLLPSSLHEPIIRDNWMYSIVIMVLIVLGGLGFPVLMNLIDWIRSRRRSWYQGKVLLRVPTKLVLYTTFILITGGALFVYFAETASSFEGLSTAEKIRQSLFLSITSRTAGFNLWPTQDLGLVSCIVVIFLMWIGGSPMSTAGGIKTLTFAVSFLNLKAVALGQKNIEVFNREIAFSSVSRSYAIILGSVLILTLSSLLLIVLEPKHPTLDVVFEAVSAFSTVGLSRGITIDLSQGGKMVIIFLMFTGRIGVLTFLGSLFNQKTHYNHKLLKESIPIS